jgi:hypothetical protein
MLTFQSDSTPKTRLIDSALRCTNNNAQGLLITSVIQHLHGALFVLDVVWLFGRATRKIGHLSRSVVCALIEFVVLIVAMRRDAFFVCDCDCSQK